LKNHRDLTHENGVTPMAISKIAEISKVLFVYFLDESVEVP